MISKSGRAVIQAGWNDAPWLDTEITTRMLANTPPHLRESRSTGKPGLGSGNVYPIGLDDITVKPFEIPAHFKHMYALDVGWNKTAALWAAIDPNTDIIYIYSEHYVGEQPPEMHALAIKSRGEWIPGVIDPASRGRSQIDGAKMITAYRRSGLRIREAKNEVESGIHNTWNRLCLGKLKVFNNLPNFQAEYILYRRDERGKIIKEKDHLMDCLRYIVNNYEVATPRRQLLGSTTREFANATRRYNV